MYFRIEHYVEPFGWFGYTTYNEGSDIDNLVCPKIKIKCKFFYSLQGWRRIGQFSLQAAKDLKFKYRVVKLYNLHTVQVLYKDHYQIAIRR